MRSRLLTADAAIASIVAAMLRFPVITAVRVSLIAACASLTILTPRVLADIGAPEATPALSRPGVATFVPSVGARFRGKAQTP
jgi:hypothetical protein